MATTCSARRRALPRIARRALGALCFVVLCATGCLELPRESTPITYWTLAPVGPAGASDLAAGASSTVRERILAVGPVSLPAYLDRAEILQRTGSHQVTLERFDHWAGTLEEQMPRVLAQDIMTLSPSTLAVPYPVLGGGRPGLQLMVTVLAFEVDAAGELQLQASWNLVNTNNGVSVARRWTRLSESAGDGSVEQIVAAMSRALVKLAQGVVEHLP
jgi:uncharacterized lipoprotein YmbA